MEELNKNVMEIRSQAQHEMILNEASEVDQVLTYTNKLMQQVRKQQVRATS